MTPCRWWQNDENGSRWNFQLFPVKLDKNKTWSGTSHCYVGVSWLNLAAESQQNQGVKHRKHLFHLVHLASCLSSVTEDVLSHRRNIHLWVLFLKIKTLLMTTLTLAAPALTWSRSRSRISSDHLGDLWHHRAAGLAASTESLSCESLMLS